jgi:hypothetical protein
VRGRGVIQRLLLSVFLYLDPWRRRGVDFQNRAFKGVNPWLASKRPVLLGVFSMLCCWPARFSFFFVLQVII